MTIDAATKAAQAALDAAKANRARVRRGRGPQRQHHRHPPRRRSLTPQSYDAAQKKAFTAVSWNAPTSTLVQRLQQNPTLKDIPGTLFLGGGAGHRQGGPIAAIGVTGRPQRRPGRAVRPGGVASLNAK
ncbi:heme-binding protein [Yinghuangia aomiensis]